MFVEIRLLGGFGVDIDGRSIPDQALRRRDAMALVKVLALQPERRSHRELVIDVLWPGLRVDEAAPRLHKAAHFARRALGGERVVVLGREVVALFPDADVQIDVTRFDAVTDSALRPGADRSAADIEAALALYGGELLPDDRYAEWAVADRSRLAARYLELLAAAGRWQDVLRREPADERAHLELLRSAVLAGDRSRALRCFDAMEGALRDELGLAPSAEALAWRERAVALAGVGGGPPEAAALGGEIAAVAAGGLLERAEALARLLAAERAAAASGRGTVALISGEAGCGKTSLIAAFQGGLPTETAVLVGGCDDMLAPRSLGPFRDMASKDRDLAAALETGRSEDVFDGVLRMMARPMVMVIEDLHWADDATIDVVRFITRRIGDLPSVLVVSVRDDALDAGHPVRRLLGGLSGRPVQRIELAPLSVGAVRELATRVGGDVDVDELHRVTKGNPFFVTEVLAAGRDDVPPTVRDAVLARTAGLSPAARTLVEQLSVIPGRVERSLARLLAGNDDVMVSVERSGILVGTPTHVAFRHELARRVVEGSLTVGERVRADAAVADALLSSVPSDPARIVHHAERAGRVDLLVRYGLPAVEEAMRFGAHRQAAGTVRRLLDHEDQFEPAAVARMLNHLAYCLYVLNEFDAALDEAERAVTVAERAGDPVILIDTLGTLSRVVYWVRGPSVAVSASARAAELAAAARDEPRLAAALTDLARAHSNLATLGCVAEPVPMATAAADRAVGLAARLGRDDLRSQALAYRGSSRLAEHDDGGRADLAEAVALSATDPRAENRVRVLVNAAGTAHRDGRFEDALAHVEAGLRLAPDAEFFAGEYRLLLTQAAVHVAAGSWPRAIAELHELVSSDRGPGAMRYLAASLLARVMARRGDPEAGVILAAPLADPIASADSVIAGPLAIAQTELRWLTGDPDPAPPIVATALRLANLAGRGALHAELCTYLVRAGDEVDPPADPVGPWAATLHGRWREAAAGWHALGERYERAVVLATCDQRDARRDGVAELRALGAIATSARVAAGPVDRTST